MIKLLLEFGAEENSYTTKECKEFITQYKKRFHFFGYSFGGNQLDRSKEKLIKELKDKYESKESTGLFKKFKTFKNMWGKRGGKNMRHTKKGKKRGKKQYTKKGGKKQLNKTRKI